MKDQELAIIKDVHFGLRDTSRPTLSFSVNMIGCGALQIFQGEALDKFIIDNNVTDIQHLEGKACIVTGAERGSRVSFVKLYEA